MTIRPCGSVFEPCGVFQRGSHCAPSRLHLRRRLDQGRRATHDEETQTQIENPESAAMPGFDHGWSHTSAVVTAWNFNDNLRAATSSPARMTRRIDALFILRP